MSQSNRVARNTASRNDCGLAQNVVFGRGVKMPEKSVPMRALHALAPRGSGMAKLPTIALGVFLVLVWSGCNRFVDHESANQYDAIELTPQNPPRADTFDATFVSTDPKPYEGSRVAKVHLAPDPVSGTMARGSLSFSSNSYGFYGGAFYFPPGLLSGASPKQQRDLEVVRWDYGNGAEYGGLRIGSDHKVRLIRGSGQSTDMIGAPFSFQEGCWNFVGVKQFLSSDPQLRVNQVTLNGQLVVSADGDPNWFGHNADHVRFGAVSSGTGTQQALDFYMDQTFITNEGLPAPGANACDPVSGSHPSVIDQSSQTPLADATSFLYTGDYPAQRGVPAGTIQQQRAAILEGTVFDHQPAAQPLGNVRVSIVGHPEFGYADSHNDGKYYLAVNGGGQLRVRLERQGYLPVERQLDVPWQQYTAVDAVVMTPLDTATTIDLSSENTTPIQVAQATPSTDATGSRTATLFFQLGTTATMKVNGTDQPLPNPFKVRATEYTLDNDPNPSTIDNNGPKAMPAELPSTSGYTYALDFTVDEATAADATSVDFHTDQAHPLVSYTDSFVPGIPVGQTVPAGYYDSAKGAWVPSENGRVIRVLSVSGGLAVLDVNGTGPASQGDLDDLHINDEERRKLAQLYGSQAPKNLWRVPIKHFTPYDLNWLIVSPDDAIKPGHTFDHVKPNGDCKQAGSSTLGCEEQVLGEHLPITGVRFGMTYRSDRSPSRVAARQIKIPLTANNAPTDPPNSLRRVEVKVDVDGNQSTHTLVGWAEGTNPPTNQSWLYTWDGKDAFGRTLQGQHMATVSVGYVYKGVYGTTSRFGYNGNGTRMTGSQSRREITIWSDYKVNLGTWDDRTRGLGGWSLDVHHVYDPNSQVLYKGDGTQQTASDVNRTIKTIAGGGQDTGEGVDATTADLFNTNGLAVGPDGSLYIAEFYHNKVRRVAPDGKIYTFAGTGTAGFSGDNGPAASAKLQGPEGLDFGPDGSLYIADRTNNAVRRVTPDGNISTVGGFSVPRDVAVTPDGALYVSADHEIKRVAPDGDVSTAFSWIGNAQVPGLSIGPDGSLYFIFGSVVNQLTNDGTVKRRAGTVDEFGSSGDGGPATAAKLNSTGDLVVLPDGSFYIADTGNYRLRYVSTEGTITRVSGKLDQNGAPQDGFAGDAGPARAATLGRPTEVALAQDGGIYVGDTSNNRVRLVQTPLPGFSGDDIAIPSSDGSELYRFDKTGRHLSTVNALTGATLYTFDYPNGLLSSVTDADGNQTQIQRPSNAQTKIVAPFGQITTLTIDGAGYATNVANNNNENTHLSYTHSESTCPGAPDGLLSSITDPQDHTSTYCYDAAGRLINATDRGGGYKTLDRDPADSQTTVTTSLGRATKYKATRNAAGDVTRTLTDPAGLQRTLEVNQDGSQNLTAQDGMRTILQSGPDPRFDFKAPILKSETTKTPQGLTLQIDGSRQASPSDPASPLQTQTDSLTVNGHTWATAYDASTRRFTTQSPFGRTTSRDIDNQGRTTRREATNIAPTSWAYYGDGRLKDQTQGGRSWHYDYKPPNQADSGLLDKVTDPAGRVTSFVEYDLAGRLKKMLLSGSREVDFAYDANGNIISVTPPSRPPHGFTFDPVDLLQDYKPPPLDQTPNAWNTTDEYNADHDLKKIKLPDGREVTFNYDDAQTHRLDGVLLPGRTTTLSYNPNTGNLDSITAQPGNEKIAFGFDGSLPTSETYTGSISASASRTYNNDLRLASSSVNHAQTVNYGYDVDGILRTAGALTLTLDPQNGLLGGTSLSNLTTSLSYNGFGELQSQTASYNQSQQVFNETITQPRDALGRITDRTETTSQGTHTYHYTYDSQTGFLSAVDKDGVPWSSHYSYDGNGNRQVAVAGSGTSGTGMYDDQDRLTSYGPLSFTYSKAGDLQSKTDLRLGAPNNMTTYGYDPLGSLQNVTLPDGTHIDYVTDGFGRRIAKKVAGSRVQGFVYGADASGPVADLTAQGTVKNRFVYATRSNAPDYLVRGSNTYRIITDHLGSPRVIVNAATGQIAQEIDYDEFGNVTRDTLPGFQPFGFAGGLYDRDTKLVHFGARDYDPEVGRWTSRDPALFGGGDTSLYGYALEDPVNYTDSLGLLANASFGGGGISDPTSPLNEVQNQMRALAVCAGPESSLNGPLVIPARKRDLAEIDAAAERAGIPRNRRGDFGDFVEREKGSGQYGDPVLSREEMDELADRFKQGDR